MFSLPAWLLLSTLVAAPADVDLVVFMAQGCPHCQQLRPELQELREAGFRVQEVDALAHRTTAAEWKVESVPTLVILRNQKEVDRVVGRLSKADLLKRLPTETAPAVNPFGSPSPTRSIGSISDAPSSTEDVLRNLNRESQVVPASVNIPPAQYNPSRAGNMPNSAAIAAAGFERMNTPRDFPSLNQPMNAIPVDPVVAKQKAMDATVRLRIESETMQSNGSGTVIWSQNGEALIITCGHIFRDMKPTDQLFVDFYRNGNWVNVPGQVLQYFADKHDIGMVKCALPFEVEPVGINYSEPLAVGSAAYSIGCDRGTPPAIRDTQITCLNRYLGEPNIEVAGAPVDGRSGGGLFDANGNLVGVCNAADHQDNEGIYAGQGQIVYQLQSLQLQIPSASTRNLAQTPAVQLPPQGTSPSSKPGSFEPASNATSPAQRFADIDTSRGQNEWLPQQEPSATTAQAAEVIMIVRDGKNPPREVRVSQPTPELLKWIDQQDSSEAAGLKR